MEVNVISELIQLWAGCGLIIAGVTRLIGGVTQFRRAGTNVPTGLDPVTQNRLYPGISTIYVSIGVTIYNVIRLVFSGLLLFIMRYGVIGCEEAYLERKFDEEYRASCAHVRL